MMHLTTDVNVVNVVGWVLLVGGLFFRAGKFAESFEGLKRNFDAFLERFEKHCEHDDRRFEEINRLIAERK